MNFFFTNDIAYEISVKIKLIVEMESKFSSTK
jgi:hypothetical protein